MEGSSNLTGMDAKLGAFDGAAALFTAMFATGDLDEAARKKTPSCEGESEKSAKWAVGFGFGGLPLGPELDPLAPGNLQAGSPAQCLYPPGIWIWL